MKAITMIKGNGYKTRFFEKTINNIIGNALVVVFEKSLNYNFDDNVKVIERVSSRYSFDNLINDILLMPSISVVGVDDIVRIFPLDNIRKKTMLMKLRSFCMTRNIKLVCTASIHPELKYVFHVNLLEKEFENRLQNNDVFESNLDDNIFIQTTKAYGDTRLLVSRNNKTEIYTITQKGDLIPMENTIIPEKIKPSDIIQLGFQLQMEFEIEGSRKYDYDIDYDEDLDLLFTNKQHYDLFIKRLEIFLMRKSLQVPVDIRWVSKIELSRRTTREEKERFTIERRVFE